MLISAGFDAHIKDALMNHGKGKLSSADFNAMTSQLVAVANDVCNGRIVSVLEGGYSPHGLSLGVEAHLTALLYLKRKYFFFELF
jgi:acetoin utilization deacetylase AcuC-like enzyme